MLALLSWMTAISSVFGIEAHGYLKRVHSTLCPEGFLVLVLVLWSPLVAPRVERHGETVVGLLVHRKEADANMRGLTRGSAPAPAATWLTTQK